MGQKSSRELHTFDDQTQQQLNALITKNGKESNNLLAARRQSQYEADLIRRNARMDLPSELEQLLFDRTYFDKDELQLFYKEFRKVSRANPYISKADFIHMFPAFASSPEFLDIVFFAIDTVNKDNDFLYFSEYINFLSCISRGSKQEKLELAFRICDMDSDGIVSKSDVLEAAHIFCKMFGNDAYEEGFAPELVDSIFSGDIPVYENKQGNFHITLPEFVRIAERDPDLYRCFGMFDYLYDAAVRPVEAELCSDMLKPEIQGHLVKQKKRRVLGALINNVQRRYIMIKNGFFIEFRHFRSTPKRVLCLLNARVKAFDRFPGKILRNAVSSNGFLLSVGSYTRIFFTHTADQAHEWVHAIRANAKGSYSFSSFAPPRLNIPAEFYVNGVEYYRALAEAIPKAKHQILIAGWWVKPELYLIRTNPLDEKYRLDVMLAERAANGVQICVLVWDETSFGITLGSSHTKYWLESLNTKIKVVRHPKAYPLTWSHHQKTVVIDQELAFVGGLDLCFMRFDDREYTLLDFYSVKFPGKDYGNLNTFVKRTGDPMVDQIDRKTIPRLPWHDVTVSVQGAAAADVAFNFIQRWNHAIEANGYSGRAHYPYLLPKSLEVEKNRSESVWQRLTSSIVLGRPSPTYQDLGRRNTTHSAQFKRPSQPNITRPSQKKLNTSFEGFNFDKRFSLPALFGSSFAKRDATTELGTYSQVSGGSPDLEASAVYNRRSCEYGGGTCSVQIVRSVCEWSAGQEVEDSCYKAYMDLIANAKNFIYIQNLYFISSTGGDRPKNRIALAIVRRIRRAILQGERFRVIILLSVYPAGPIAELATKMIIGWCMKTICRGEKSIFGMLQAQFPNVDINEYISFYALRNWAHADDRLFTEEIYVHSKIMIIDDRIALVGSANINDRSMRGTRDSEICAVISDSIQFESTMWGLPVRVSKFAHNLRKKLWAMHLGIESEVERDTVLYDPIHPSTFHGIWRSRAINNSILYSEVFGDALPENHKKMSEIKRSIPLTSPEQLEKLQQIRGFLICFPLHFFEDEPVEPTVFNKEFFLNTNIFI